MPTNNSNELVNKFFISMRGHAVWSESSPLAYSMSGAELVVPVFCVLAHLSCFNSCTVKTASRIEVSLERLENPEIEFTTPVLPVSKTPLYLDKWLPQCFYWKHIRMAGASKYYKFKVGLVSFLYLLFIMKSKYLVSLFHNAEISK